MQDKKKLDMVIAQNECLRLENQSLREMCKILDKRIENLENMILELFGDEEKENIAF